MSSVLREILAHKAEEVAAARRRIALAGFESRLTPSDRDFRGALAQAGRRFIFEVKKASPSRGPIRPDLEIGELLALYEAYADCISVLTDSRYFGGDKDDLIAARALTTRPLLRKDFIIDPYQISEARLWGADCVLLIAAALDDAQLIDFRAQALAMNMDALVEVHDEVELERALKADVDLLGINNRNLNDLTTDLAVTGRLAALVPDDVLLVSESGINSHHDVRRLAAHADAFLIGSSILASPDMEARVKELAFGRVKVCGITNRADAEAALAAGASWLGFIFHEGSPRAIQPDSCARITRALPGVKVGVFVNKRLEEICDIARLTGLHGLQLHGDYREADVRQLKAQLPETFVTRVLPVSDRMVELPESEADYLLLDTFDPDRHGGTGRRFNYDLLNGLIEHDADRFARQVILAGGLKPENIAAAAALSPCALDLASGVESEPGRKDPAKLKALFKALRED
ncbi:MAG: bifunctional indole-3-glycerol-phosphate synthase TrpC/phosphoribosylanthranilate isomerase TrpF [bacterium]|nr:bifunctional indole-3-glycerol-phosphate synthase TrpC/phosphoribosylanthranilate isomerase TrpF [bacterium]